MISQIETADPRQDPQRRQECIETAGQYGISADRALKCNAGDVECFDCPIKFKARA